VKAPTPEEEDRRRLCRERKVLIAERVKHVNRVKGLLFSQGVRGPAIKDRCIWLAVCQNGFALEAEHRPPTVDAAKIEIAHRREFARAMFGELVRRQNRPFQLAAKFLYASREVHGWPMQVGA